MMNTKLLITGGSGSFGNAVLDRFLDRFDEIRIFSRDEKKQDDMRIKYNNDKIKFYIGDVRSRQSVDDTMSGVDYVFHAAALKQVPSCEFFPLEAVYTNIIGCENVLSSAIDHKVKKVVVLSTDKAVYPINAMGMTKALSEKVMIAKSRNSNTILCATRYGNVMGSRGSVIPLFINQIKKGVPITVTNPNMTRFMMSMDDATGLVIYAFEHGNNGDIFVQKSPACTIDTLARALTEIYGVSNGIKIIGSRHGEKLYETLISSEEMLNTNEEDKFYVIHSDNRSLNYSNYFINGNIIQKESYTSHNTKRLNLKGTKKLLNENIVNCQYS